jgi:cytochrome oxidase assembly protein ShyY1
LFIRLSDWQFDRYNQRISNNETTSLSLLSEPELVENVDQLNGLIDWQRVSLNGTFIDKESRLIRKQYLESNLGFYVITPFVTDTQLKILINRGWIPIGESASVVQTIPPAPAGNIKITGHIQSFDNTKINPSDLPENQMNFLQSSYFNNLSNTNKYIQLDSSNLLESEVISIPLPVISNGPHLSYAIQWILFALLLPIGWYVLLKNEQK